MKRIGFVVQRYGPEVNGGSETHCRQLAERLAADYEVLVLTSCALDHITWKNHFPPGESEINGVRVLRFAVDRPRNYKRFEKKFYPPAFENQHAYQHGLAWELEQGPRCFGLLEHLSRHKGDFDAIIFMTYLYAPTFFGLHIAPERSILVPTAHNETPIHLNIFNSLFHLPKHILYNTESERRFIESRYHNGDIPCDVAGVGVDLPTEVPALDLAGRFGLGTDYLLYVGRIDEGKNVAPMVEDFIAWRRQANSGVMLALAGQQTVDLPSHKAVKPLGFVSEEEKVALMNSTRALVLPSKQESLSMVTLEAMSLATPVLVNGECDVLAEHIRLSGGGYTYTGREEFFDRASRLTGDGDAAAAMGQKGRAYVEENYQWPAILGKIRAAIERVSAL